MFKWCCLAVAACFLVAVVWMLNDLRLEIRSATKTINEHLPEIVERTHATTDTVAQNLPEIVEKTRATTETLAELAQDIRQIKELAGVTSAAGRDRNLVAYADSVLDRIEKSGGAIGTRKTFGSGLKNLQPAQEWAAGARKEAVVLTLLAKSKRDLLDRLCKSLFGSSWYIQFEGKEPVTLLDWLRANHPESKEV